MLPGVWRSLLQFALIGAALFAADRLWWRAGPAPLVIPADRAFDLDEELLYRAALDRGYERDDPVVFRRLVQNLRFAGASEQRDDAALFEEALALHMQETDPVVRRRLVERMRLDLEAGAPGRDPSEAELREYYDRHAATYQSAARIRCTQLYFRADHERAARRLLAKLRTGATPPDRALGLGEPFLHGVEQPLQTREELAGRFGAQFADGVFAAPTAAWSDPIPSAYGVHLVFVQEREGPRARGFAEVRDAVRNEVIAERRRAALERGLRVLRREIPIAIEPSP
jgi:PPIC-type PPIASE domain